MLNAIRIVKKNLKLSESNYEGNNVALNNDYTNDKIEDDYDKNNPNTLQDEDTLFFSLLSKTGNETLSKFDNLKKMFLGESLLSVCCLIHKIQLIITDLFSKNDFIMNIKSKIIKSFKLLKKTEFKKFYFFIPDFCETRWNSFFNILEKFINNKIKYNLFLEELQNFQPNFEIDELISLTDFRLLKKIKIILNPIYNITKLLEIQCPNNLDIYDF